VLVRGGRSPYPRLVTPRVVGPRWWAWPVVRLGLWSLLAGAMAFTLGARLTGVSGGIGVGPAAAKAVASGGADPVSHHAPPSGRAEAGRLVAEAVPAVSGGHFRAAPPSGEMPVWSGSVSTVRVGAPEGVALAANGGGHTTQIVGTGGSRAPPRPAVAY
jgi:hypothetical protein